MQHNINVLYLVVTIFPAIVLLVNSQVPQPYELPNNVQTIVGGRAEFFCVVKPLLNYEIVWLIQHFAETYRILEVPASKNQSIAIEMFLINTDLGHYSTWYNDADREKVHYGLRISNTTIRDGRSLRFACGHDSLQGQTLFHDWVYLEVVTPPGNPECAYHSVYEIPAVITDTILVTFVCSVMDGRPLPTVTWYSEGIALTGNTTVVNAPTLPITKEDNGREFVCLVDSVALTEPLRCTLTPYNVFPEVSITPTVLQLNRGIRNDDIKLVCTNIGSHTNDTEFKWYLQEVMSENIMIKNSNKYEIMHSHNRSILVFRNISTIKNNTQVFCTISIPSVSSANGSALILKVEYVLESSTVAYEKNVNHTITTTTESPRNGFDFKFLIFGAIGGGTTLVILTILIIVICCLRRKRNLQRSQEPKIKLTKNASSNQSNRNHGLMTYGDKDNYHGDTEKCEKHDLDMPMYALPNQSAKPGNHSSSEMPVYALPDKSRPSTSQKTENDIPTYAFPNKDKTSTSRQSGHSSLSTTYSTDDHGMQAYDDVHVPSSQSDQVPIETIEDDGNSAYSKVSLQNASENLADNVDGLAYADLDLPSSNVNCDAGIVHPQTSTLYSEVRIS